MTRWTSENMPRKGQLKDTADCVIKRNITHFMTLTQGDWCNSHTCWIATCSECGCEFHTMRPHGVRTCGDTCRKRSSRNAKKSSRKKV